MFPIGRGNLSSSVCGPPSLNPAAGSCALDGIISSMAHTANRGLRESLRARLSATTT